VSSSPGSTLSPSPLSGPNQKVYPSVALVTVVLLIQHCAVSALAGRRCARRDETYRHLLDHKVPVGAF
jgi:hypothetical protein